MLRFKVHDPGCWNIAAIQTWRPFFGPEASGKGRDSLFNIEILRVFAVKP